MIFRDIINHGWWKNDEIELIGWYGPWNPAGEHSNPVDCTRKSVENLKLGIMASRPSSAYLSPHSFLLHAQSSLVTSSIDPRLPPPRSNCRLSLFKNPPASNWCLIDPSDDDFFFLFFFLILRIFVVHLRTKILRIPFFFVYRSFVDLQKN